MPSEFVGAIIGRKGQTIRNITTQSRARYRFQLSLCTLNAGPIFCVENCCSTRTPADCSASVEDSSEKRASSTNEIVAEI